jgi:FkbM family methyltransferase
MQPITDLSEVATMSRADFESACRANTSYVYLGNCTGMCQVLSKHKIFVDTRDFGVTPHFILDGFWESWITQFMATIIKPGDVCIDIGANFGYYSILMAQLAGEGGKTIAVEPNPNIAKLLRFTSNLQSRNFTVAETALSNKSGRATLNIPESYFGSASLLKGLSAKWGKGKSVKVQKKTLDQLVQEQELLKVDVIKMDVEGIEPLVFEGMRSTIANNPDLKIIMEYTPEAYEDARKFTTFLCENFEVQRIWGATHLEKIDVGDIDRMISMKDHIDVFLQGK